MGSKLIVDIILLFAVIAALITADALDAGKVVFGLITFAYSVAFAANSRWRE